MGPEPEPDALAALRDALEEVAAGARDLDRACRRAAGLLDGLVRDDRGAPAAGHECEAARTGAASKEAVGEIPALEAALLVGVTARGGTVDGPTLETLAARLGLAAGALEPLFAGPAPHLVRRARGAAGVTERGVEAAARWRETLPAELLRAATEG